MRHYYTVIKDATGWNVMDRTFAYNANQGDVLVTRNTKAMADWVRTILIKIDRLDAMLPGFAEIGNLRAKVTLPNIATEELQKIENALNVLLD